MIWAPLCLLPGFLAGCSGFRLLGLFPFCWLLSGAPGFQSFFSFSSAQISLGPSCSSLSPLGLFLVGSCVCLGYLRSSVCPSPSPGGIPVGIASFLYGSLPVALSHLPGGVQLFCFPLAPFQSVLVCPGRWLIFLALSSASARLSIVVFSVPCGLGGASATFPAALHPDSLWPVGCSTVLLSGLVAVCFLESGLLHSLAD